MLKTVIVNPNKKNIEDIKSILVRRAYDFNVSALCQDTTTAINLIKHSPPDIMICEFESENIDAVAIINEAERLFKPVYFILTGEVKFNGEILKPHVVGALSSPINSRELYPLMDKAKELIDSNNLFMHYQLYSFLNNIMQSENSYYGTYIRKMGASKSPNENYRYITVMCDTLTEDYISGKSLSYERIEQMMFIRLSNFMGEEYSCRIFKEGLAEYGLVISDKQLKQLGMTIYECAGSIKELFSESNMEISVLTGRSVESINWLGKSKESIKALKILKFYSETGVIINYDDTENISFSSTLSDTSVISSLINTISDGNDKDISLAISNFIKECKNEYLTPVCFKQQIAKIISGVSEKISDLNGDIKEINHKYLSLDKISDVTVDIVRVFLFDFSKKANEYIKTLAKNDGVDIVKNIYEFVKTNYSEDISLSYFAKKHFINVSYLGQIFKKHTNMSFNEYLTEIRISEAKKILLSGKKIKVHEIAQKIGFKDPNYFCMTFKKVTGTTPSKFKEENINRLKES